MTEPAENFEESMAALEAIVRDLEDGRTGLDDALALHERGVSLLKLCYAKLRQAEQRILVLTGVGEDGQPAVKPFEHSAAVEAEKPAAKRSRKAGE